MNNQVYVVIEPCKNYLDQNNYKIVRVYESYDDAKFFADSKSKTFIKQVPFFKKKKSLMELDFPSVPKESPSFDFLLENS